MIERIQVEEGFLDGLDLTFVSGLNVLIGPRGSGKTSVIELIRFCLDVKGITEVRNGSAPACAVHTRFRPSYRHRTRGERGRAGCEERPRRGS